MTPRWWCQQVDRREFLGVSGLVLGALGSTEGAKPALLPTGVKAVWDLDKAHRERTATRERVYLNGLWRWQPDSEAAEAVPDDGWGYFKVPGFWPGNSNDIQEDCQTLYAHLKWRGADLRGTRAAWYQRELTVPEDWTGRRIALCAEYVNSLAVVYVDGKKVGAVRFPAGEVDLTAACRPGGKHVLSLLVVAMPLKGVLLSYTDANSAREVKGSLGRRGPCGDVYLVGTPAAARVTDVKVDTSVRESEVTVSAALAGLAAGAAYALHVKIKQDGRTACEFTGKAFKVGDLKGGRVAATEKWKPDTLWDVHSPQNTLIAEVSLVDAAGKLMDACAPVRFGFREFWIDGRDFYLNGTRIYLSAVPLDSAQIGARAATYEGARETLKQLQAFGINFVYTHNYGCEPGSHVSFAEVLRAADDVGILVAFSQPHFSHYDWKAADADRANGYARHAEFYVRAAQNHPSAVAYSMSHNATGYDEDMNPDLIDGIRDPRHDTWSQNNAKLALRAEAIVSALDPGRVVYRHSSGNPGSMHTVNFYLNFVPSQEISDWFEHWASKGVKPVFPCEYGVPYTWDWTMYRGWYKGRREWSSAKVPWEFCLAEWNAQFLGDLAYRISEAEKKNLRWEAKQFRAGNLWHRWNYPHPVGSSEFDARQEVFAQYITDNWRAHRTWGISANSPWEYAAFWNVRDGADRSRKEFKIEWERLQRPGFSPDYTQRRGWQISADGEWSDWVPTLAALALLRNNRPLLGRCCAAGAFSPRVGLLLAGEDSATQGQAAVATPPAARSRLLEYHEGKGMVLFCQVDVTARTEGEPGAGALVRNILRYVSGWKPSPRRKALYAGDLAGKRHLESAGLSLTSYTTDGLVADPVLIVGPGCGKELARDAAALGKWLKEGGHVLALGLDGAEAEAFLPSRAMMNKREHIAAYFEAPGAKSLFVGIGPADVHNRDPRELPLLTAGAAILGGGILAKADNANVVFCQLVPWQFDPKKQMNLKRTFRRAACLVTRLAANMGAAGSTPLLAHFLNPVEASKSEERWLDGLYLDVPEEWDDPYRFFRW